MATRWRWIWLAGVFGLVVWAGCDGSAEGSSSGVRATSGATSRPIGAFMLVSFNMHGADCDLGKVAELVRERRGDVVCLQEVQRTRRGRQGSDQAVELAEMLGGYEVVSATSLGLSKGQACDVAILSKFALSAARGHSLETGGFVFAVSGEFEGTCGRVRIFSVHAHATFRMEMRHALESSRTRVRQVEALIREVKGIRGDVIIAGDFNSMPDSGEHRMMCGAWRDLGAEKGVAEATFPTERPMIRIDYVFGRGGWSAGEYVVIRAGTSDHRAVAARMERGDGGE